MPSFTPPTGYARIRVVGSFDELVSTPFAGGVNALCWARTLPGDFEEIVTRLGALSDIIPIDEEQLARLDLSEAGRAAARALLEDQKLLTAHGMAPVLDAIPAYPRDSDAEIVPTDVYSLHADRATIEADTYLCTYAGAPSEGLRNDQALRHVDIPETRAKLLKLSGGEEGAAFEEFLRENCYDLHHAAMPGAVPFSFGVGNMWRIAVEYPSSPVPPCIHRAPMTKPGDAARLLLIS